MKSKKKLRSLFICLIAVLGLSVFFGGTPQAKKQEQVKTMTLCVGETVTITSKMLCGKRVKADRFTTSNAKVAPLLKKVKGKTRAYYAVTGKKAVKVTAKKTGTTVIRMKKGNQTYSLKIKVKENNGTVDPDETLYVPIEATETLTFSGNPAKELDADGVKWSLSNKNIFKLTVDESGQYADIKAKEPGKAIIFVTYRGVTYKQIMFAYEEEEVEAEDEDEETPGDEEDDSHEQDDYFDDEPTEEPADGDSTEDASGETTEEDIDADDFVEDADEDEDEEDDVDEEEIEEEDAGDAAGKEYIPVPDFSDKYQKKWLKAAWTLSQNNVSCKEARANGRSNYAATSLDGKHFYQAYSTNLRNSRRYQNKTPKDGWVCCSFVASLFYNYCGNDTVSNKQIRAKMRASHRRYKYVYEHCTSMKPSYFEGSGQFKRLVNNKDYIAAVKSRIGKRTSYSMEEWYDDFEDYLMNDLQVQVGDVIFVGQDVRYSKGKFIRQRTIQHHIMMIGCIEDGHIYIFDDSGHKSGIHLVSLKTRMLADSNLYYYRKDVFKAKLKKLMKRTVKVTGAGGTKKEHPLYAGMRKKNTISIYRLKGTPKQTY